MLLTYGRRSFRHWLSAFTMYPIALAVFKSANLRESFIRALLPQAVYICGDCISVLLQTINLVRLTQYVGTTVNAAPVLGIICGLIGTFYWIYLCLSWEAPLPEAEGFEADDNKDSCRSRLETVWDPVLAAGFRLLVCCCSSGSSKNECTHIALLIERYFYVRCCSTKSEIIRHSGITCGCYRQRHKIWLLHNHKAVSLVTVQWYLLMQVVFLVMRWFIWAVTR